MARQVRIRAVKRIEIDADQLALAVLLLARSIHEREQATSSTSALDDSDSNEEAA